MHGRFNLSLLVLGSSLGLWHLGNSSPSWGQIILTCPVRQGCSTTIGSGADYATISGGQLNAIGANVDYATISGGRSNFVSDDYATVGGGQFNDATRDYATVGGGVKNTASGFVSTVGGGEVNNATASYATVGGGALNDATALYATVGGGTNNDATNAYATVGGGIKNLASGPRATVSGGYLNTASGFGAMVPGGGANAAFGNYSWAGGFQAKAWHKGAFVWADTTATNFPSTAANQFNVRASGGTRIFTNAAATVGVQLLPGSNSWNIASDRALKEDFHDIDKQAVLAKVQQLDIQNWKLKDEAGNVRHVGPVAQDFQAAFQLGGDDRSIHTGDAHGIALVAIQALAEHNDALMKQNQTLEQRVEALQQQLRQVVQQVQTLVQERYTATSSFPR